MQKRIKVEDLQVGMMITDVGRSWMNHPFLTKQKRVHSPKEIQKLKDYGILEVTVEIETESESLLEFAEEEKNNLSLPSSERDLQNKIPFAQELKCARLVKQEAHLLVRDYMQDIRAGKNIESEKAKQVVNQMIDSIFRNRDALASLTRLKGYDEYTFVHSINVCILCLALGRHLNFSYEELQQIGIGALLHDAGKMKVPPHILNKPGKVTEEEYGAIKKHPLYTLEVLEKAGEIPDASMQMAVQHHERYNGKGYPYGLAGDQIIPFGQIAAIIDVYDAITSDRCYQRGIPPYEGIRKIYEWAKTDFNQRLVENFIQCIGIYPVGTLVQLDTDEVGIVYSINHENLLRPEVLLIFRDFHSLYSNPVWVDLGEEKGDAQTFKRSILKPLDPLEWNVNIEQYLAQVPSPGEFN
jgi:HD-GYP domain-containing protein (c-di-GMP phosphodiesterase class II)